MRNDLKQRRQLVTTSVLSRKQRMLKQAAGWIDSLENRRMFATVNWVAAGDGNWSTPSNWLDDQNVARVPNSNDDVIINPTGTRTITVDGTQSVKSITLTGDDTLNNNGFLTIAGNSTIKQLVMSQFTTLTNNGTLTLSGTSSVARAVQLNGTGTIVDSGAMTFNGDAIKVNTEIQVTGTFQMTANSITTGAPANKIRVHSGGVMTLEAVYVAPNNNGGGVVVETGGTLNLLASGNTISVDGGSVNVKRSAIYGIASTMGGDLHNATFNVDADAQLYLGYNSSIVNASGTISGSGAGPTYVSQYSTLKATADTEINIPGAGFIFRGASMIDGPGTVTNNGMSGTDGTGHVTLKTKLLNSGTYKNTTYGTYIAGTAGEFRNKSGGTISGSGFFDRPDAATTNPGMFLESGSTVYANVGGIGFNSLLPLDVNNATFKADAGFNFGFSGNTNINGADFQLAGGNITYFGDGSVTTLAGTIKGTGGERMIRFFVSPTVNIAAAGATLDTSPRFFGFYNTKINGPGTLTSLGGVLLENNAVINTELVLKSGESRSQAFLAVNGPGGKLRIMNGATLDLYGGSATIGGDSTLGLVIDAGGTLTTHGFGVGENSISIPVNNLGTIHGFGSSVNIAGPIANVTTTNGVTSLTGGTWIEEPDGIFRFGGDFTNTTKVNRVGPGTTIIAGSSRVPWVFIPIQGLTTNEGTIEITNARATNGGGVPFGANFTNSGKLTVRAGAVIEVGTFAQTSTGSVSFEVAGSATNSIGQIRASGAATLAGKAAATLATGFTPGATDHFTLMTFASRSGTFTLAPGYDPVYTNTNFALNVISSASSDLAGDSITLPASAAVGGTLPFSFKVKNLSAVSTPGSNWIDSAYLSLDNVLDASDITLGQFNQNGALGSGLTYSNSVSPNISAVAAGDYYVILVADSQGKISDTDRSNNILVSGSTVSISVPTLAIGTPLNVSIPGGKDVLYRIDVPAGKTVKFTATGANLQVLSTIGRLPIPGDPVTTGSPISTILTITGPNYVRITNPQAGTANVTLSASLIGLSVSSATPASVGRGPATITVTGAGFGADATVKLFSGSTEVASASVARVDSKTLYASFNLTNVAAGSYALRVTSAGSSSDAPSPVVVTNVTTNTLPVTLSLSGGGPIRAFRDSEIILEYSNPNAVDIPAPIIVLASDNGMFALGNATNFTRASMEVLGIGKNGPAGVLAPGAKGSITLNFRQVNSGAHVESTIGAFVLSPTETIDWSKMKNDLRPANMPAAAWDKIYSNFTSMVGTTAGQYQNLLTAIATHLDILGQRTNDVAELMHHALAIAGNFSQLSKQYTSGHFGAGQSDPYNVTASVNSDGVVSIGSDGQFAYYIPTSSTTYATQLAGDTSTLTRGSGGTFVQTFPDGSEVIFNSNGTLRSTKAPGGLLTTATITNGLVTAMSDAQGTTSIAYNAQKLISSVTNQYGRVTSYSYDASGNLTSVTDAHGATLFEYANPASHAVTKTTLPDGSGTVLTYDSFGRPATRSNLDGSNLITVTYDAFGGATTTDALNHASHVDFGRTGEPRRMINERGDIQSYFGTTRGGSQTTAGPSGQTGVRTSDSNGNITGGVSAAGSSSQVTYDAAGNITSITDPLGHKTIITRDASGKPIGTTDPAGKSSTLTYDSIGQETSATSAAGRIISSTYTSTGRLATQTYSDGSSASFTYDAHDNVLTATNAFGTLTYTYDVADRPTSVTYPNGLLITYGYNAKGQLISKTDQSGFKTEYTYDSNGRLLTVATGATTLTAYTYDAIGRVSRVDSGNGTYTTHVFDELNHVTLLVNHAADGSTQSSFAYTYDSSGRVTSMTTLAGTTTYSYDVLNQLTKVVLPGGRTLQYTYDAVGNRISATDSAASTTNYATNDLNQYTAAGTTTYTYDDDGNLLTSTDGSGTTTYTYDTLQQLISITGPGGTTSYTYDAQGHRVAQTINGVTSRLLNDPLEDQLLGTFDVSNAVQAHYAYGAGLSSQITGGGAVSYYAFDALGNTSSLTDASGAIVNAYTYLPFGEKLSQSGSAMNPFTYAGNGGVVDQGDGTYLTKTRLYDARIGRFIQRDPSSFNGGDLNLYRYAANNPVSANDPSGLITVMGSLGYLKDDLHIAETLTDLASESTANVRLWLKLTAESQANALRHFGNLVNAGVKLTDVVPGGKEILAKAVVRSAETHAFELARLQGELGVRAAKERIAQQTVKNVAARALTESLLGLSFNLLLFEKEAFDYNLKYNEEFPDGTPVDVQAGVNQNKLLARILKDPLGRELLNAFQSAHPGEVVTDDGLLLILQTISISERVKNKTHIKKDALTSGDPNEIIGPGGAGAGGHITPDHALPYTIYFQNKPDASAAAQEIFVTTTLDPNADLSTFELDSIGFGSTVIPVPAGLQSYTTRVSYKQPGTGTNILVDISATLDASTRQIKWTLRTLDPTTLDLPSSPATGVLPPDTSDGRGSGFVSYTVRDKAGLTTGETIKAQASIVFDTNDAIITNQWLNTIDNGAPSSRVNVLAATQGSASFTVSWTGTDDAGGPSGSGVATYDVFVSDNGGAFTLFKDDIAGNSALFNGVNGHTYSFYSIATDNVGYVESKAPSTEATTMVNTNTGGTNVPPVASLSGPSAGVRGQTLSFKLSAIDANAADNTAGFIYKINFGDGTSQTINRSSGNGVGVTVDHVYVGKGNFKITLTATDKGGKVSAAVSRTVSISAVAMLADPTDSSKQALFVGGTSGRDAIRFDKAGSQIKLTINGVSQGNFSPSGRIFAYGLGGDDLIQIAGDIPTNVVFFGNDGNDVLHGGAGMNALFGGAGKDTIYGHGGRDIVIGGSGKDLVKGDGSGDIFIGGRTSFDTGTFSQLKQISEILSAWNTLESYATRIAKITSGVGSTKAKFSSATVSDDNEKDDMHGGTGLDWFFARISGSNKDQVHSDPGETITKI